MRNITKTCAERRRRFTTKTGFHDGPNTQTMMTVALRAFEGVGVDYSGSFMTKQGRGRDKPVLFGNAVLVKEGDVNLCFS